MSERKARPTGQNLNSPGSQGQSENEELLAEKSQDVSKNDEQLQTTEWKSIIENNKLQPQKL